jgi:acetyl-CoA carboxylase biotin carboxyl carrier protein
MIKLKKMDLKDIQELIKFVAKSGATEVDLEIDNIKISIKSPPKKKRGEEDENTTTIQEAPAVIEAAPVQIVTSPVITPVVESLPSENTNYITIKSSMIGTFYRSSSPEIPPFVNVGDSIKVGDPVCIIEAMKLFNEIESEVSGKIVKVLVDDTTPIEFDQPLFLVDPS